MALDLSELIVYYRDKWRYGTLQTMAVSSFSIFTYAYYFLQIQSQLCGYKR